MFRLAPPGPSSDHLPPSDPRNIPREGPLREFFGLSQHAQALKDQRQQRRNQFKRLVSPEYDRYRSDYKNLLADFRKQEYEIKKAVRKGYQGSAKEVFKEGKVSESMRDRPELARRKMMGGFRDRRRRAIASLRKNYDDRVKELRKQANDPGSLAA